MPKKGAAGELVEGETENGVSLVPSAPPAHMSLSVVLEGDGDLLSLEPPTWTPDSQALSCTRCKAPFRCRTLVFAHHKFLLFVPVKAMRRHHKVQLCLLSCNCLLQMQLNKDRR